MNSTGGLSSSSVNAETQCCLYGLPVTEGTASVKRKIFHGNACESAKSLLDDLFLETWQMSVNSFKEMIDSPKSKAYLCHHCYNKAKKCSDLIDNVKKILGEFLSSASKLTTLPSCRKRPASMRDNPTISTAVVQSVVPQSVGEIVMSQNGVNIVNITAGILSPEPPGSPSPKFLINHPQSV